MLKKSVIDVTKELKGNLLDSLCGARKDRCDSSSSVESEAHFEISWCFSLFVILIIIFCAPLLYDQKRPLSTVRSNYLYSHIKFLSK